MSNYTYIYNDTELLHSPGKTIHIKNEEVDCDVDFWYYNAFINNKSNHTVFIETGTHIGTGISAAFAAGFKKAYSIEINPEYYNISKEKWNHKSNVQLYLGDTKNELPKIMEVINEPVLFWLDAHIDDSSATYNELEIIKNHHIKTHTLLIDDINLYFNKNELIDNILKINSDYIIGYEPTWRGSHEILVAKLKN